MGLCFSNSNVSAKKGSALAHNETTPFEPVSSPTTSPCNDTLAHKPAGLSFVASSHLDVAPSKVQSSGAIRSTEEADKDSVEEHATVVNTHAEVAATQAKAASVAAAEASAAAAAASLALAAIEADVYEPPSNGVL